LRNLPNKQTNKQTPMKSRLWRR